jgi:hypothetical protein
MTRYNDRESGMLLLTAWILLGLLSLAIISQFTTIILQQKTVNKLLLKQKISNSLESLALDLIKLNHAQWKSNCMVSSHINPNQILHDLPSGCIINKNASHYKLIIENLGIMPCVVILSHDIAYDTQHWRLTLGLLKNHLWQYVQIRFASIANRTLCDHMHIIKSNIISWRSGKYESE